MTTSAEVGLAGTGGGRAVEMEAMAGLLDGGVREAGRRGYAEALRLIEEQLARVAAMSASIGER